MSKDTIPETIPDFLTKRRVKQREAKTWPYSKKIVRYRVATESAYWELADGRVSFITGKGARCESLYTVDELEKYVQTVSGWVKEEVYV